MPNYGLVVNPTYNPMKFEDYIKPFTMYNEAYNQARDKFDALRMQANVWEALKDSENDSKQYQQYKNFSEGLEAAAHELEQNGLKGANKNLSTLRSRYAGEIIPIENAFNRRLEAQKAEDQMRAKDNSWVPVKSAYDSPLDDYMTGSTPIVGVSGTDVYTRALNATAAITKAMSLTPEQKKWFSKAVWDLVTGVGEVNAEQAYNYIRSQGQGADENQAALFSKYVDAINDVLNSTAYNQLSDDNKAQIYNYAVNGAITGIQYDEQHHTSTNPYIGRTSTSKSTSPRYEVLEYETDGKTPKIVYFPGSSGKPGYVGTPVFDKNKKVTDVNPIKQDGKVIPFNPQNDEWDSENQRIIVNGKQQQKERAQQTSQLLSKIQPAIWTNGLGDENLEELVDNESLKTKMEDKEVKNAKAVSYDDLDSDLKEHAKKYVKARLDGVEPTDELMRNFTYKVYIYDKENKQGKYYRGKKGHTVFLMYPRGHRTAPVQTTNQLETQSIPAVSEGLETAGAF